jgi:hypothetical protein
MIVEGGGAQEGLVSHEPFLSEKVLMILLNGSHHPLSRGMWHLLREFVHL